MPSWWGKSSSKDVKRKTANRRSLIDAIQRKFKSGSEDKNSGKTGGSQRYYKDTLSEKGVPLSKSVSPSLQASRCQSFSEQSHAQPLPLPELHLSTVGHAYSISPLSRHGCDPNKPLAQDAWGDLVTASVSSNSSMDIDDCGSGNITAINSPSSKRHKGQRKAANNMACNNHFTRTCKKRGMTKLHIPPRAGFFSAPHSSISSPSRSPMRPCSHEQGIRCGFSLGHCSSPGSGQNSGHNSSVGVLWAQIRGSPECSPPIPSPRLTSPRVQSGGVIPLRPRDGGFVTELHDDGNGMMPQSHKLPLPPIITSASCPFPSSYSTVPRNPGPAERSTAPVSRWKKGRLIGSGTFGLVYLGFNSESGEMCAMKEVTLFLDDAKSKESVQQLGQEITLLSSLRHPNIVRYLGSETVDDKLYIYLEYVSGGSIHKLVREYGQLGQSAIRSYTQQILSGLAYLHAKNTVHRDIKGANILVDPSGRVKLADFGMAKHITGQACPLSFKGSPYWMAPEVIRNPGGCNLAVDIWSLGCTVIEMATAKPPWSQYEGVAALFKIGNSKELPAIPDHLSEEGKDFVRRCLQRDPLDRPTAVQLLEHPFVRNAAPPERCLINSDPLEPPWTVTNASSLHKGTGHTKRFSCIDSEAGHLSKGFKNDSRSSDPCIPRYLSCPVSPIGSPLLQPKSSHPMGRRSMAAASCSSTPYTGGNDAFRRHHFGSRTPSREHRPTTSCSVPKTSQLLKNRDIVSTRSISLGNEFVVELAIRVNRSGSG